MPFDCLEVALEAVRETKSLIDEIAKRDPDLARQLRRSSQSVPQNVAEGRERVGRDQPHSYRIARGEAGESVASIRIAIAWGYVGEELAAAPLALFDRVRAMLWRLTH